MRVARLATLALAVGLLALAGTAAADTAVEHDGANVTLDAGAAQTVAGQTDLAPGTEIVVRVRSTDSQNPFLVTGESTVGENGTYAVSIDLSDVEPGTTGELSVRGPNGTELTNETVRVTACDADCTRSTPTESSGSGAHVDHTGANLTLSAGVEQTVTGETDLAAGTELSVRVRSSGGQPFLVTAETTVDEGGAFAATLDLSEVDAPQTAELVVHANNGTVATQSVVIGPCGEGCQPVPPTELELYEDIVQAPAGETAAINLSMGNASQAVVQIGDRDVNYVTSARVTDANGDGRVVVRFDTAAPAANETALSAAGADTLTVLDPGRQVEGGLDPAPYDIDVYRNAGADRPATIGTLVLTERAERAGGEATTGEGDEAGERDGSGAATTDADGRTASGQDDRAATTHDDGQATAAGRDGGAPVDDTTLIGGAVGVLALAGASVRLFV